MLRAANGMEFDTNWLRKFPPDFRWGTATAAYQIEGAVNEDGRGRSIWDAFSHTPNKTWHGDTGDLACDHYHRYREDVDLMRQLGVGHYRFSVAWPRIYPTGGGTLNIDGVAFYDRLLDTLLAAGIRPVVTLYHWDLPQALEERGGWRNRDTVYYFRDYAGRMFEQFGDRIDTWITHNEPWCTAVLGHLLGQHAPGIQDPAQAGVVAHHLLLSHGLSVQAYRSQRAGGQIGITLNLSAVYPASDRPEDLAARDRMDTILNRSFLDPIFLGNYPSGLNEMLGSAGEAVRGDDMAQIGSPLDFLGVNYYTYQVVAHDADQTELAGVKDVTPRDEVTDMGWPVGPAGLTDLLRRVHGQYTRIPLMVTENGAAYPDQLVDDRVRDSARISYLKRHIGALGDALDSGVDLRGYYVWSLLDNFEWSFGYSKRFGLVYVDYDAGQRRLPKDSAWWYRDFIQAFRRAWT